MTPELKSKWLAALRSGEYKQCRNKLWDDIAPGKLGFCCIGVLYELADNCSGNLPDVSTQNLFAHERDIQTFCNVTGLPRKDMTKLATLNDDGVPFTEIADMIEADASI